ncbi:MAG TPA: YjbE family putative metal transport protein [Candidatus Limnocylindria bacterium]|jgi:YjbE family integral membrane protein
MIETLQAILAIVLIDLALSGDNALVIGMAARDLPPEQRRRAIVFGGLGAVVLRVLAASVVVFLLAIPYLQLVAALVLLVIAYRLVHPNEAHGGRTVRAAAGLRAAIVTILLADAAMSLENILGVGAAAHGSIALLAFGLALSIPIVLFGSTLVVSLLTRYPRAIWLGALALIWTAAEMILDEPAFPIREAIPWSAELVLTAALLGLVAATRGAARSRRRPA